MTNEEAIKFLKEPRMWEWLNVAQQIAIDMAIDALSQQPCTEFVDDLPPVQSKYNTSEWCHDCKEYDQDKHCCPRYNKVIRNAVEEMKQQPCEDVPDTNVGNMDSNDCVSLTKEAYTDLVDRETKYSDLEPCEDAISRAETVQFLRNHSNDFKDVKIGMAFQAAASLVNNPYNLPCVHPIRPKGHWIIHKRHRECSECKVWLPKDMLRNSYCPNCGAEMILSTESEE